MICEDEGDSEEGGPMFGKLHPCGAHLREQAGHAGMMKEPGRRSEEH